METIHPEVNNKRRDHFFFPLLVGSISLLVISCAMVGTILPLPNTSTNEPSTTQVVNWSGARIAKPTYTPHPTALNPEAPILTPIHSPALALTPTNAPPSIGMKIVQDTATPIWNPKDIPPNPTRPEQGLSGPKYVLVSISQQHLYAYDNGQLISTFVASTGMNNSTRVGTFSVLDKIPNAYGANWNIWMPNWLGIYWVGNLEDGIHALPILPGGARLWSGYLGTPISFGCVVLGVKEAAWLYSWAQIGTTIQIRR